MHSEARRARRVRLVPLAWLLLFAGHVIGLAYPSAVNAWNAAEWRLYALETTGLLIGLSSLFAWVVSVLRLVGSKRPLAADAADTVFWGMTLVGVISGLFIAVAYRWGS